MTQENNQQHPASAAPAMLRRSQRIELAEPLEGIFGVMPVTVIDLSEQGATIEHAEPLPIRAREPMRIAARQEIAVTGVVRHSVMVPAEGGRAAYRSGIVFQQVPEETAAILESILVDEAATLVRLWEANAEGTTSSPAILAMQQRSARRAPAAYIWMRFVGGSWDRVSTLDPNQPLDGFAVPASETPQQLALLCKTYEKGSKDERNLIRALAQLAIAENIRDRRG